MKKAYIFCVEEIQKSKDSKIKGDLDAAFSHLERAHILGQDSASLHTQVHVEMLKLALFRKDLNEVVGQCFRIPTGFIGSLINMYPKGNTGGANVNPFSSMPIPDDLKQIIEDSEAEGTSD